MYRFRSGGAIATKSEVEATLPNTSLPSVWDSSILDMLGVDPVFESPAPTVTQYQVAYRSGVEQIDGKWFWKWFISELDDEAKASKDAEQAKAVRSDRDKRLADCDWTQVADAPVNKTVWATYRQALRNIPQQPGFPWNVTWPSQPE
jgi:hypothetical protein